MTYENAALLAAGLDPEHVAIVLRAQSAGLDLAKILALVVQYGPVVLTILEAVLPLLPRHFVGGAPPCVPS